MFKKYEKLIENKEDATEKKYIFLAYNIYFKNTGWLWSPFKIPNEYVMSGKSSQTYIYTG